MAHTPPLPQSSTCQISRPVLPLTGLAWQGGGRNLDLVRETCQAVIEKPGTVDAVSRQRGRVARMEGKTHRSPGTGCLRSWAVLERTRLPNR
jgi:hypothetical protein